MDMRALAGSLGVLLALGCGDDGDSARALCEQAAEADCANVYRCLDAAAIEARGYPPSQEQCLAARVPGCEGRTAETACEEGTYDEGRFAACVDELQQLACDRVGSEHEIAACAESCVGGGQQGDL